ncbi:MAG: hypothetical protein ACR2LM_17205, partial [Pyrinomonadaceae bacterium]
MSNNLKTLILALLAGLTLGGCAKKEEPAGGQIAVNAAPESSPQPSPVLVTNISTSGFDVNKVPLVNPQLGKFPYFGLIEGYRRSGRGGDKDVDFDRYEFFDGTKIIQIEGRLTTMEAEGHGASAFQVF